MPKHRHRQNKYVFYPEKEIYNIRSVIAVMLGPVIWPRKEAMSVVEIAYVDPIMMMVDTSKLSIPVGTIGVIPHIPEADLERSTLEVGEEESSLIPIWTILAAGQELIRAEYPELSAKYPNTGGYYSFVVPNLRHSFIIGVNVETDEILWGDGVIYYQSIPIPEKQVRDVRQI